jgi:predicted MFS family arabinose efflux permease
MTDSNGELRPLPAGGAELSPDHIRLGSETSSRPFRILLFGQAVSSLGSWMATVALMALVLDLTGSATAVGGVLVLRLLPTILAAPVAARLIPRWNARRMMLAMDAVRIPAVLVLPWVTELWWIYTWAVLVELAGILFLPARDSSIPKLVDDDDDLAVANGMVLGSSYGMIPLGAGLFALVAALAGGTGGVGAARAVFAVNALTFFISFLAISRLPRIGAGSVADTQDSPGRFMDAFQLPLVRELALVAAVVAAGLGALFSLGIVWVREVLGASDSDFGILVACFGIGGVGGLLTLRAISSRGLELVRLALAALGVVIATMSLAPVIGLALLGALAFGGLCTIVLATSMEVLQTEVGERERMLAFTAFHVVIRLGLAVAAMGAGITADRLDQTNWPLVGRLAASQVVLLSSGLLVLIVALTSRRIRPTET